jgi:hypothetical protein
VGRGWVSHAEAKLTGPGANGQVSTERGQDATAWRANGGKWLWEALKLAIAVRWPTVAGLAGGGTGTG